MPVVVSATNVWTSFQRQQESRLLISGLEQVTSGQIIYKDKNITNLKEDEISQIRNLFTSSGINIKLLKPLNLEDLYEAMQSDKKKEVSNLNFILMETIGSAKKYSNISKKDVLDSVERSIFPP